MSYRAATLLANPSRPMRDGWSLQASHCILTRTRVRCGAVWLGLAAMAWHAKVRRVRSGMVRQGKLGVLGSIGSARCSSIKKSIRRRLVGNNSRYSSIPPQFAVCTMTVQTVQ
jgi:hypothetical protein